MANDNSAYIPEKWAFESLIILRENMVMGNLVHTDFSNEVARDGDVVHTRRPSDHDVINKTDADDITVQDATAADVSVKLDRHYHISIVLKDGELSKSFKDLVTEHLEPMVIGIARGIDRSLLYEGYNFQNNIVGKAGTALDRETMNCVEENFNENNVPVLDRNIVVGARGKKQLQGDSGLIDADKTGDGGRALRTAEMGSIFGVQTWLDQNVPQVKDAADIEIGAIDEALGYIAGTTVLTVDGFVGVDVLNGAWIRVVGDDTPQKVVAHTLSVGDTVEITVSPGLRNAVVDNAEIYYTLPARVDLGAGYPANYGKTIVVDQITTVPVIGQLASHAANPLNFGIFTPAPTLTGLALSKNSPFAMADDDIIGLGPKGNYNFAFHRNALALVSRPLILPQVQGGNFAVVANEGIGVRVSITYDGTKQGLIVTLDLLCGTQVLDDRMGMIVLS